MSVLYSAEYEKCVLGSMLMDNSCIDRVVADVKPDHFFLTQNRNLFCNISYIYKKNGMCDLVMLTQMSKDSTPAYIASLTDKVASSENIDFYTSQLTNFYTARQVQQFFDENSSKVTNLNVQDVVTKISELSMNLINNTMPNSVDTSQTLVESFVDVIREGLQNKKEFLGVKTGIESFDHKLDGLPLGALTILAARPSIGKTALATILASNIAEGGNPVAVFSLEMTSKSLMGRIVTQKTGISSFRIKHGFGIGQGELAKINHALERIYDTKMWFFDSTNCSTNINQIVAKIRALAKEGLKVVFIDHLGFVQNPSSTSTQRYEQVGKITKILARLCKQLDIAIVCLCQLKRDSEGKRPCLNDLRESGDIEQDADICLFLHRDRAQGDEDVIPTDLIIEKNRDGECGTIKLDFYPKYTLFKDSSENKVSPK